MSIKAFFICWLFLFSSALSYAQDDSAVYNKELSIITENDNYNFTLKDRYYSNGFFIRFNWLSNKPANDRVLKTIHRTEAGQMIFNPFYNRRSVDTVLKTMDRPFAGWLYASYGQTKIFRNNDVLQFDAVIGILGPAALGKQIQTGYHKLVRLYSIYGWDYQLQNETGINASVQYYRSLLRNQPAHVSLHAVGKAIVGNTFTNASAGFLFKAGLKEAEEHTAYWSGRMGQTNEKGQHKTEAFLFLEPVLMAQAYNATVQGGLFRSDKGLYTSPLNPFLYQIKTGAVLSGKKTSLSIIYTFKQREAASMMKQMEVFGAFAVAVRFR